MIKLLKTYKLLKTVKKHFKDKNVTIFKRTVCGYFSDEIRVNKYIIRDRIYEVYKGQVDIYPQKLKENEFIEIIIL